MRIICVEEHLSDPDLTLACRDKVLREAPYTAYWGKTFKDTAADIDHSRPLLTSTNYVKANIGLDAKSRLAEMDRNGLDMQILSYTSLATARSRVRRARAKIAPFGNGQAYQNYCDLKIKNPLKAYYGSNLPRLREIKQAVDPDDRFRPAQGIRA